MAFVLVAVVFAVYSNTLSAPFVFDDHSSIRNNISIRELWPPAPAELGGTRGRPVANWSYALNYALGGYSPVGFHLFNTAIHAACALTLFGLVRRTMRQSTRGVTSERAANLFAGATALIWAVHPLHTESVTYLSQRTESLMGFFYLATLYCFARGVDSTGRPAAWLALSVAACYAGMATKETMVTAPVVVLLYDRAFARGDLWLALRTRYRFYAALGSSWLVLASLLSGIASRGAGFSLGVSPLEYALTEACVVLNYLRLSVWPAPLIFDYGDDIVRSLREAWPCCILLLGLATAVLINLVRRPAFGFLLAWPFLLLAPTSSFVPIALRPMAEHRMYLPLAALVVLAVLALRHVVATGRWMIVGLLSIVLGSVAHHRNEAYRDEIRLWRDTVTKRPANSRAHLNLGAAYLNRGQIAAARFHLSQAIALNPRNPEAFVNLGCLAAQSGQFAEALAHFEAALRLNPASTTALYNRGCVLQKTGKLADAGRAFAEALRLNPNYGEAHNNLATVLAAAGRFESAISHYSESLRIAPADAEVHANRADAYRALGKTTDAIADYLTALALRPDMVDIRSKLQALQSVPPK